MSLTNQININVEKFHRQGGGHNYTKAAVKLVNASDAVSQDSDGTIVVTAEADLNFVFTNADGSAADTAYLPVGIAFKDNAGKGSGDPSGVKTFPEFEVEFEDVTFGTTETEVRVLEVEDLHPDGDKETTFEFVIVLQEADSGDIGLIDPKITNKPPR